VRLLRRLIILLVGLWVVVELAAVPVTGQILAHEVASRTRDATTVHASVGSFPVIARVFFMQRVSSASVTLDRVTGQRIPFSRIRFDVKGVGIDRTQLLQGKFRVTSIDSGSVAATVDLPGGVASRVSVRGRTLVLGPVALALRSDLFPCSPDARVEGQQVILTCSFTNIPPILVEQAR
jgi:hypothetical protein